LGKDVEGDSIHIPVLPGEVLEALRIHPDGVYADLTAGKGGGHLTSIIGKLTTGTAIAFDRDPEAAESLRVKFAGDPRVRIINENFAGIEDLWKREGLPGADGILIDFGLSSQQLGDPERGFSFQRDGALDMRYRRTEPGPNASDIVNEWTERELVELFFKFGESNARRIARRIVGERQDAPIETTGRLAGLIGRAAPGRGRIHPATKVFLALRVTVNRELEAVESVLPAAIRILRPGGTLAVITYHSLEDRIAKEHFRRAARGCKCGLAADECVCSNPPAIKLINKKVIVPGSEETERNPRARSARMRVIEALGSSEE
jgi:16S rRNA (cytosine1402-N4)-methyltransferase